MTGEEHGRLREGVLGAYPSEDDLTTLLREKMEISFDAIARGDSYSNRIFNLITDLDAEGRLEEFIQVLTNDKPNSPYLKEFKQLLDTIPNLPYLPSAHFFGREKDLEELHKRLQKNNQIAICAVAGMGGIGKTELAIQYIMQKKPIYPGGICWLNANLDVGSQIIIFARSHLNLIIPQDIEFSAQVASCWRKWSQGSVLLVYDDVSDYQDIKRYLPPPTETRFKVLLTSRQKLLSPSQRLDLDVLDEENALKLLAAILDDGRIEAELEAAKNLCKWLGYLPLALELVGSYLSLSPLMSITQVQKQLELLSLDSPLLTSEEKGVATAFELTWQDPKLSFQAKELACRLSLFGAAPIAWEWVERCYYNHGLFPYLENLTELRRNAQEYQKFQQLW
jgi:hypothetical protein